MAPKKTGETTTFRIADTKRAEVRGAPRGKQVESEPAAGSVGFPAIESRLENGTIEDLADELRESYEKLEDLTTSRDAKKRTAAKKAMAAYERTADLFEYLYETKDALQGSGG